MFKKSVKMPGGSTGIADLEAAQADRAVRTARSAIADQELAMQERKGGDEEETETEEVTSGDLPLVRRPGARDNKWRLNVFFTRGSAALDERYHEKLDKLLISRRNLVYVAAYTDKEGAHKSNWALAKKRAVAVRDYLRSKHPKTRFKVKVYGEYIARFSYKGEEGMVKNNCVLVLVR